MADPASAYLPIEDYAVIGDCGSAALISKHGSIDWLCWPDFHSPSIFAALLDAEEGGFFHIQPVGDYTVERRYVGDTNVLETTFTTDEGVLRLTDCMPVAMPAAYDYTFWPDHEILRAVACTAGEVTVDVACDPRLDYARIDPPLSERGALGYFYNYGAQALIIRSEIPLTLSENRGALHGRTTLAAGDERVLAMTFEEGEPAVLPLLGAHAQQKIDDTIDYWQTWSARCTYEGPYRDAVVRSALTLKLMTFSQSGAIVAAPTTSLPEAIGGERNWDYRYCWLRDAALALRALFELGYDEEGQAFFAWLLHATRLTVPRLRVLYDVYGRIHLDEHTLDHLEGYRGSTPVRIGNGAQNQLQLDVYGEVVSAAYEYVMRGGTLDGWQARMLQKLGDEVVQRWPEPDEGIWEIRAGRRQHTYSKVMCWVALDRLLKMHEGGAVQIAADRYRRVRDAIRAVVEGRGYNTALDSYVATLDGDTVDASLLLLPIYGYTEAGAPRMRSTYARIQDELGHDSLLHRYAPGTEDGLHSREGAFGLCSFWDEEILARRGDVEKAKTHMEKMLPYANDVGLFAEEIDPATGAALGNFPQAFTHIGFINAALSIANAERGETIDPQEHP